MHHDSKMEELGSNTDFSSKQKRLKKGNSLIQVRLNTQK